MEISNKSDELFSMDRSEHRLTILNKDVHSLENRLFDIQMADSHDELIGVEDLIAELCVKKSLINMLETKSLFF